MSEPTGKFGFYGRGYYWIRWAAYDREDVLMQYADDPAELVDLYDRWAAAGDGTISVSAGVGALLRARRKPAEAP